MGLFYSYAVNAQTERNALVFEMKDGASVTYFFTELPKLSFTAEDIVVTTRMYETSHPQKAVLRYVFTYKDPSSIVRPQLEGFRRQGDIISIGNLNADDMVTVYSADGKLLLSVSANAHGSATVSLTLLPAGVYLIKYSDTTVKVLKS